MYKQSIFVRLHLRNMKYNSQNNCPAININRLICQGNFYSSYANAKYIYGTAQNIKQIKQPNGQFHRFHIPNVKAIKLVIWNRNLHKLSGITTTPTPIRRTAKKMKPHTHARRTHFREWIPQCKPTSTYSNSLTCNQHLHNAFTDRKPESSSSNAFRQSSLTTYSHLGNTRSHCSNCVRVARFAIISLGNPLNIS